MRRRLQERAVFLACAVAVVIGAIWPATALPDTSHSETTRESFRLHMPTEPTSLDPALITSADASYFLTNVMRGLYRLSGANELVPDGARHCEFRSARVLSCELDPRAKWSDGSGVVAEDYVRSFRRLAKASGKSLGLEMLKNVKNAEAIRAGKIDAAQLGVRAGGALRLIINFAKPDPDFLYKLTTCVLVPVKNDVFPGREASAGAITNGPYKVASWTPGKRIRLESNPIYERGAGTRPSVEILIVDEDETALALYEQGELSFLRRLPTNYIANYKMRADFVQVPVARFDYLGFGEDLKDQAELRAALALSADYRELERITHALGRPGCPGLDPRLADKLECVEFNLVEARKHLAKVSSEVRARPLRMTFSKLGGDDVKKSAEWFQGQWKKNLGLYVALESLEQGVHLQQLRSHAPPLFRKGLHLPRPTCLAVLEAFANEGSEDFLQDSDIVLEKKIQELTALTISETVDKPVGPKAANRKRAVCDEGLERVLRDWRIVPLGRIHFTLLAKTRFQGWSLNELNQLDLAELKQRK